MNDMPSLWSKYPGEREGQRPSLSGRLQDGEEVIHIRLCR